jgi:hypothetical protein
MPELFYPLFLCLSSFSATGQAQDIRTIEAQRASAAMRCIPPQAANFLIAGPGVQQA